MQDLNRLKKRKQRWDSFLKEVAINAPTNDTEFSVSNLCNEVRAVTSRGRPYRACRQYKASEKKLIHSFVTYETNNSCKVNPMRSYKKKRRKAVKNEINLPKSTNKTSKDKSLKLNRIATNLLQKESNLSVNEEGSSGYCSSVNSRRTSIYSVATIYKSATAEIIESTLNNISLDADRMQSNYPITMEVIRNLALVYSLPLNNFEYVCLYLKQTKFAIDLCAMIKLVHLIEDIKQVKLKNFMFGMQILESLDKMADIKFKELSDKVKRVITNLCRTVSVDVIETYVDFILWMFDYKKKFVTTS